MHRIARAALALLVIALLAGTAPALAQEQQGNSAAQKIQQEYTEAIELYKQAQGLVGTNPEQAAATYKQSYTKMTQVADMLEQEGMAGKADQLRQKAAQVAYAAGQVLYKADQFEAAIPHFQAGMEIYPAFAKNRQGLNAAQQSMQTGPVYAAAQALNAGSTSEALELLNQVEPSADVYFYKAIAYQKMNQPAKSLDFANQALEAGGNSATREGYLHLIIGEAQIALGNQDAARASLKQAQAQGSAQTSARAQALLDQIGE